MNAIFQVQDRLFNGGPTVHRYLAEDSPELMETDPLAIYFEQNGAPQPQLCPFKVIFR